MQKFLDKMTLLLQTVLRVQKKETKPDAILRIHPIQTLSGETVFLICKSHIQINRETLCITAKSYFFYYTTIQENIEGIFVELYQERSTKDLFPKQTSRKTTRGLIFLLLNIDFAVLRHFLGSSVYFLPYINTSRNTRQNRPREGSIFLL